MAMLVNLEEWIQSSTKENGDLNTGGLNADGLNAGGLNTGD